MGVKTKSNEQTAKDQTMNGKTSKKNPFTKRFIHQGQNVHLFRERAGLSQSDLAQKIGKTQQFISSLEQEEIIEPEMVNIIAQALEIDPQYITDWTTDNSMNIFNIQQMGDGEGSTNMVGTNNFETNHEVHIYPLEKVCELYERMLNEKDTKINNLEIKVESQQEEIKGLRNDIKELKDLMINK